MFDTFLILVAGLKAYRFEVGGRFYWDRISKDRFPECLFNDVQKVLRKMPSFSFDLFYDANFVLYSLNYGDLDSCYKNKGTGCKIDDASFDSECLAWPILILLLFVTFLNSNGLLLGVVSLGTVYF